MRHTRTEPRKLTRRDFVLGSAGVGAGLFLLGGCGTSQGDQSAALRFMNWVSAEDATKENIQQVFQAFQEQNQGLNINSVSIPYDQMRQQLLTTASAGNLPDIVMLNGAWGYTLGSQGALADLNELAGSDFTAKFSDRALEAGTFQGSLYAAPLSLTQQGFWFNKELMEQAGLDPEQPPETMQDLDEQMAQIKDELGDQDVFPIAVDTANLEVTLKNFFTWFFAFDAYPLYDGKPNFDTPEVGAALQWLRGLTQKEYTPVGQQIKVLREYEANDRVVFWLDGPFTTGILRSLNPDLEGDAFYEKFGVTTVPVGVNGESQVLANLHQLGISARSERPEEALKFVNFLESSNVSIEDYQVPYGVIPALKSAQQREAFDDPVSQTFINEIQPTMIAGPFGPGYGEAWQIAVKALQQAALEDMPIPEIQRQAQSRLEPVYDQQ